jgi:hypothetical protein
MTCYQVNLMPNVIVHLGAVYALPSGRYVRVLEQNAIGWLVESVCVRDMQALPHGVMALTGFFVWYCGQLCWTAEQWQGRVMRLATEIDAVKQMRERRALAAEQDVARAKAIDAEYAAKKVAELAERAANRNTMRLAA